MLPTIINVNTDTPPASGGHGNYYQIADFHTVAFERDFMEHTIGFGEPRFRLGQFVGFDPARNWGTLELGVWLGFVPIAYRDDVVDVMQPLWNEFGREKIQIDSIPQIVAFVQCWICQRIVPCDEPLSRRQRFANAWYDIGVMAAYQSGAITRAQAQQLREAR